MPFLGPSSLSPNTPQRELWYIYDYSYVNPHTDTNHHFVAFCRKVMQSERYKLLAVVMMPAKSVSNLDALLNASSAEKLESSLRGCLPDADLLNFPCTRAMVLFDETACASTGDRVRAFGRSRECSVLGLLVLMNPFQVVVKNGGAAAAAAALPEGEPEVAIVAVGAPVPAGFTASQFIRVIYGFLPEDEFDDEYCLLFRQLANLREGVARMIGSKFGVKYDLLDRFCAEPTAQNLKLMLGRRNTTRLFGVDYIVGSSA